MDSKLKEISNPIESDAYACILLYDRHKYEIYNTYIFCVKFVFNLLYHQPLVIIIIFLPFTLNKRVSILESHSSPFSYATFLQFPKQRQNLKQA